MSIEFGYFSEFSDSVTKGDPVMMAAAKAVNLGPYEAAFYQSMGKLPKALTQKVYEVYTRSRTPRGGTVSANWNTSATTGLKVAAEALLGLTVGHQLQFGTDGEVVVIKSVDRNAGTIDVYSRGAGGTKAAAHNSGDRFDVIGSAGSDDDLERVEGFNETTNKYRNAVQTVLEAINWTLHGELDRKGLVDNREFILNLVEAQRRVAVLLARMSIRGVKQIPENDSDRYMAAGLLNQLTDNNGGKRSPNVVQSVGTLTEQIVHDKILEVLNQGGVIDTLWVHPTVKGYLDKFPFANTSLTLVADKNSQTSGLGQVKNIEVNGLIIPVRQDSDMPDDAIAAVCQADCKKGWLEGDGLRITDEPEKSTRKKRKAIQGSVGFLVENVGINHLLFRGITDGPKERVHKVSIQGGTVPARQITVNADADVPAASADNFGFCVKIGTGWTKGTKIVTAVAGEVYASNGTAWIKQ